MIRFASVAVVLVSAAAIAWPASAQAERGKAAYTRVCESCHGAGAKGGGQGPALVPFDKDLQELQAIVRQGIGMMPAIPREKLSDEEIGQVRDYLIGLGHGVFESVVARAFSSARRTGHARLKTSRYKNRNRSS